MKINKNLKIFYSSYKPTNIDDFKNKKLLAFAGIGNPANFFELLERYNLDIKEKLIYPDHYNFKQIEIDEIITQSKKEDVKLS